MSTSPKVEFSFENNNVVQTAPATGVSFVYAATSKGPVNDASTLITSVAAFRRLYGEELSGDPVSQIERALKNGSKLRICRVIGAGSSPAAIAGGTISIEDVATLNFSFKYPYDDMGTNPTLKFETTNNRTYLVFANENEELERVYLFSTVTKSSGEETRKFEWDIDGLVKFNNLSTYLNIYVSEDKTDGKVTDTTKLYDYLQTLDSFEISTTESTITKGIYKSPSTAEDYTQTVLDVLSDYTDVYQVAFSGINSLLKTQAEIRKVHKAWADIYVPLQEYTLYIEVPSEIGKGTEQVVTLQSTINWVTDHINALGNSKYIAYFAGGLKIYDSQGIIRNTDAMGTILGLGDTSASNYGPWKSFAGMNRGIIFDAIGPVLPNYGASSRYAQLNELAQAYINTIVIKDTPSYGKQALLWHLFSSQFKQNSERFLSIVRLNLYLKKTLRPILEKYIEEPNHWITWKNIFIEVKPILDALIDQEAISQYQWIGDQDANSYADLSINTEAEVRQGIYRVQLSYKDIVPMQDIFINITIDTVDQNITITSE